MFKHSYFSLKSKREAVMFATNGQSAMSHIYLIIKYSDHCITNRVDIKKTDKEKAGNLKLPA